MRPTHTLFCLFLFADFKEVNNLRSFERSELERNASFSIRTENLQKLIILLVPYNRANSFGVNVFLPRENTEKITGKYQ